MLILQSFVLAGFISLLDAQSNPYCYRTYKDPCSGSEPTDFIDGDLIDPRLPEEKLTNLPSGDAGSSSSSSRNKRGATAVRDFLWPNGKVYYVLSKDYSDDEKDIILRSMHGIENRTCIRFIEGANANGYINIFKGIGCCSYVGYIGCGEQGLSLNSPCVSTGTVTHELLHAIGFYHEHSRPDRDSYVRVIKENIRPEALPNFAKLSTSDVDSLGIDYDYNSVMHYCGNTFSVSRNKQTIIPLDTNASLCTICEMSTLDALQVNLLYKCDIKNPPPLTTSLPPVSSPPALTKPFPNCGSILDGILSGTFSSPGFDTSSYPHNSKCGWALRAKEGYTMDIRLEISLEFTRGCTKDSVQSFYGLQSSRKYCGEVALTFSGVTEVNIHMITDASNAASSRTYKGIKGTITSKDINECDRRLCSHGCINTPGSFYCTCPEGMYLSSCNNRCYDINECIEGGHKCDLNVSRCRNTFGSYSCECNPGLKQLPDKRTCQKDVAVTCAVNNGGCSHTCKDTDKGISCSCKSGYELGSDKSTCNDINECLVENGKCRQLCLNKNGSHECGCYQGYSLNADGVSCNAINQCDALPESSNCKDVCYSIPSGFFCFCALKTGFRYASDFRSCIDINECEKDNGGCEHNCVNTVGSYRCGCGDGFTASPDGSTCQDINECSDNNGGCSDLCVNTVGSFECRCNDGYKYDSTTQTCKDINECSSNNGGCDQTCHNTIGSFFCSCRFGYTLNGKSSCQDTNECSFSNGGCAQVCTNTEGSYTCSCNRGYTLNSDGKTCQDVNECSTNKGGCDHTCTNTGGSYVCSCKDGYVLGSDKKTCEDKNECLGEANSCSHTCVNTPGSFNCTCPDDYVLTSDKMTCEKVTQASTCGGELTNESGKITVDSSVQSNCTWMLRMQDTSKIVSLKIDSMDLGKDEEDSCSKCFIEIFNGNSTTVQGKYCRQEGANKVIKSVMNVMTVKYVSVGCTGSFQISYTTETDKRSVTDCTAVTVIASGKGVTNVATPGFPSPGTTSSQCQIYIFAVFLKIRVTLQYVDEISDCSSNNNYLTYYNSFSTTSQFLVEEVCNPKSTVVLESNSYGLLRFKNDQIKRGFYATIEIYE